MSDDDVTLIPAGDSFSLARALDNPPRWQRDQARAIAVQLEQENAELRAKLRRIEAKAREFTTMNGRNADIEFGARVVAWTIIDLHPLDGCA